MTTLKTTLPTLEALSFVWIDLKLPGGETPKLPGVTSQNYDGTSPYVTVLAMADKERVMQMSVARQQVSERRTG